MSTLEVESARTTGLVMTALVNDPEIGARSITVRVTRGVVQLSGLVRSEAEVARAVALAGAVPGVTRVDASLRVGADRPRSTQAPPDQDTPGVRDPASEFAELDATPGRFAIGGAFVASRPSAAAFAPAWSLSPLVRLGAGKGLGAAAIFDWHGASVAAAPGSSESRLRVRPVMAGVRYTATAGRVAISPSLVGGYAFNRIIVPNTGAADRLAVDAENSLVWRPGVSLWIDAGRRTVVNLSVGRVLTRLNVTFVEAGAIEQRTVSGDATTVSVGLVYRLF
ncbi:MAG: BON domain-containing protein [Acidobacteriota bacterium]|nr:BON domain-containing protein [Acidobacteriota bacterium]